MEFKIGDKVKSSYFALTGEIVGKVKKNFKVKIKKIPNGFLLYQHSDGNYYIRYNSPKGRSYEISELEDDFLWLRKEDLQKID